MYVSNVMIQQGTVINSIIYSTRTLTLCGRPLGSKTILNSWRGFGTLNPNSYALDNERNLSALGRAKRFQSTTGIVCQSQSLPLMHFRAMKCLSNQPQGTEYGREGFVRGEID